MSDSDGCFSRSHGTNRIYVTESVEWPGRPIVNLKNLTIVGRKDGDITLDGKWLLEKETSGSFENITFKTGQAHCLEDPDLCELRIYKKR